MAVDDIRSVGVEARIEGIEGFPRSYVCVCARARVCVRLDRWTAMCGLEREIPRVPTGREKGGTHPRGLMTILAIPYRSNARLRLFVCIMIICS